MEHFDTASPRVGLTRCYGIIEPIPTSGEVGGIVDVPGPRGVPAQAIEIIADGEDRGEPPFEPIPDWRNADPEILKKVKLYGLFDFQKMPDIKIQFFKLA